MIPWHFSGSTNDTGGPLFRYFLRQCNNDRDIAGDLFQDVWTKIIKARLNYEATAKFTTYMYQIAHNSLVDHIRRQSRRPGERGGPGVDPDELAASGGVEQGAEQVELGAQLRAAVEALPDEQREAFLLREEG